MSEEEAVMLEDGRNMFELKVTELREVLESHGLSKAGTKAVMQERLIQFLKSQPADGAAPVTNGTANGDSREGAGADVKEGKATENDNATEDAPAAADESTDVAEEAAPESVDEPVKMETNDSAANDKSADASAEPSAPAATESEPPVKTEEDAVDSAMDAEPSTASAQIEPAATAKDGEAATDTDTVKAEETEEGDPRELLVKRMDKTTLAQEVKDSLIAIVDSEQLTNDDLDDRILELLSTFPAPDCQKWLVAQLADVNMMGVASRVSYVMALLRGFRDRVRNQGPQMAITNPLVAGPPADKVKELLDRTGYTVEVTIGQRKYGGPPPDYDGPDVTSEGGHECYVGRIPRDCFEDELVPLFETIGKLYDMRLMMDANTGMMRGYAFVTYCQNGDAKKAQEKYDNYELKPGKKLKVNVSVANTRVFLGNIPKTKSKEEIMQELQTMTDGVSDVIVYAPVDESRGNKNRGFCFVQFSTHKAASDAKRRLERGRIRPWNADLVIDWAESQDEPDEDTMQKVKVLYVRNLAEGVDEAKLRELFAEYGEIEKCNRLRDFAFVHFKEREDALKGIEGVHDKEVSGKKLEVQLARPQSNNRRQQQQTFGAPGNMYGQGRGMRGQRGGFQRGGGFNTRGRAYGQPGGGRGGAGYGYGQQAYGAYPQQAAWPQYGGGYGAYDYSGYYGAAQQQMTDYYGGHGAGGYGSYGSGYGGAQGYAGGATPYGTYGAQGASAYARGGASPGGFRGAKRPAGDVSYGAGAKRFAGGQ